MTRRAYGPACEEDKCGMMADAGLDNTEHGPGGSEAAGEEGAGPSDAKPRDRAAPEMPDLRKLAQDWITLWQSELSAMAADREMQESWQTVMALWAGTMSTALRGLPRAGSHDGTSGRPGAADAPWATPSAAAPDSRDAEIERLARDVAALERRLAELERGGDPPVPAKPNPKPRPG